MPQGTEAPAGSMAEGPTSHTQNQAAGLAKLREDFPSEQISKLPRLKCPQCRDSRTKVCENPRHAKQECKECGNYVSVYHLHLDYVGHAELTNRLLEADPLWDWEPVAFDQRGLPAFDDNGGLWIRLTVCGHSRLGYGDAQGKKGPNAVKEAIGDALRNAAMRFGAALDLWAKSDLREAQSEHPKSAEDDGYVTGGGRPARPAQEPSRPVSVPKASSAAAQEGQEPVDHLARLRAQATGCWGNALSLAQIVLDAEKHGVADSEIELKTGGVVTFRELLNGQINELSRRAEQGGTERGAA